MPPKSGGPLEDATENPWEHATDKIHDDFRALGGSPARRGPEPGDARRRRPSASARQAEQPIILYYIIV